jgi:hydroxyacid-oxoacid transhydrogenase
MTISTAVRIAPSRAARAVNLLRTVQFTHPSSCPCHANPNYHNQTPSTIHQARRHLATPVDFSQQKEYAFEMAASSIRFGPGCTKEVGMDFKNMGSKRVMVVTDQNVRKLDAMKQVVEGLSREGVTFEIYDKVRVEPKDSSIKEAIDFAKPWKPDAFLAVGGGSVIDTAKLMNLYTTFPGMTSGRHDLRFSELTDLRGRLPRLRQRTPRQGPTYSRKALPSRRRAHDSRNRV